MKISPRRGMARGAVAGLAGHTPPSKPRCKSQPNPSRIIALHWLRDDAAEPDRKAA